MTEDQAVDKCLRGNQRTIKSFLCDRCGEVGFSVSDDFRVKGDVRACSASCAKAARRGKCFTQGRRSTVRGYVQVTVGIRKWEFEHRLEMERVLGRKLSARENVHHKNGNRADNHHSNLELWAKPQPAGQRVEDLVAWVVEAYPAEVRTKLMLRDALSRHSNSIPEPLITKTETAGAGNGL